MSYTDETLHLISHYPIYAVERGGVRFAYVAVGPGRVVAIGNVHLPATPYGPEMVRDGKSAAEVLKTERETRLPEIRPYLRPLSRQAARGVPTFLTGDFNSPSHLDWTPAVAAVRPQVKYPLRWPVSAALAGAGFRDSYREIYPDPVARPGLTWTAGTPPPRVRGPRDARPDRLGDGERAGHDARQQAGRGARRPGRGHRHAVGLRPPLGGVDVRRHGGAGSSARARRAARRARAATRSCSATSARAAPPSGSASCRPAEAGRSHRCRSRTPPTTARPTSAPPACGRAPTARACSATADLLASSRFWVQGRHERPRIRTSRRVYRPGQPVGLRWSGMPGNKYDWVGIYRATRPLDLYGYYGFRYLGALPAGRLSMTSADTGTLAPGRYVAGLFLDDGYALLARTSFRVKR